MRTHTGEVQPSTLEAVERLVGGLDPVVYMSRAVGVAERCPEVFHGALDLKRGLRDFPDRDEDQGTLAIH